MRGPPSKSRGHRTPASSLLDRRHRCWMLTNGGTHNTEPTNHNHTSSLSVVRSPKNELCSAWGPPPLFKKCHACQASPVTSWRQRRARTRRRGARQGQLGKGSEGTNHVLAYPGGRGRAHVDAAFIRTVGNQRPAQKFSPPPGDAAAPADETRPRPPIPTRAQARHAAPPGI
jgi:hypothetical protein